HASPRFAPAQWGGTFEASVLDILEQSSTGRVLAYDPTNGATRVLASGFSFANCIAPSGDGKTLFVNETGRYRIWKVDAQSGKRTILFDNLPGYPDNLMRGRDGKIWVGLVKPRNATIDKLAQKTFMRTLTL